MFPRFERSRRTSAGSRYGLDREDARLGDAVLPHPGPSAEVSGPGGSNTEADQRLIAAILRSAPDAVILFDADGRVAEWSPAAESLLGYSRDEAVGRELLGLIFPARLHPAMETVIASRGASWGEAARRAIEVSVRTREGEELPAEMTLSWAGGAELFAVHLTDRRERGERENEQISDSRRRTAVNELGRTVMGPFDLDNLISDVLEVAAEFGGLESCELWCLDPAGGDLELRASLGPRFGDAPTGLRLRPVPGSKLAEALHETGERLVFGDGLLPDPLGGSGSLVSAGRTAPGVAALVVGADSPIGVLSGVARPGFTFTATESSHLTSLALIVAGAIERDAFQASISQAEGRLRNLIERLPAITYEAGLGLGGRWHYISPQVTEIFGFTVEECLADPDWWERQIHPEDLTRVLAEEERCAAAGEALDVEYRIRDRHGRMLWIRDRAAMAEPSGGEVSVEGLMIDVTAEKQAEMRLRRLTDHDTLTGLLNRRGFEQRLDQALAGPHAGGCVAVIDIDHMKRLNDMRGHAAGDAILREIGIALSDALAVGQLLGRLSSDEFAVYLPGVNEAEAREILRLLQERIGAVPAPAAITASAGATLAHQGSTGAELLVAADLALYGSKQRGRDRITIDLGTEGTGMEWVGRVREAIENGALAVYSQPIFDLRTGGQRSEELLVRMVGSAGSLVAADRFIPVAERFGLIRRVDRFVVERAIEAVAEGRTVNVNISAASVADPDLTDLVAAKLDQFGVPDPSMLTFEITETGATPALETLRSFAARVGELGCRLALDDVGAGFGSLVYLQNLDVRQIKIDMQFVRGLGGDTDEGIVRSLVTIARELGLETVAEGVESELVRRRLCELGVDLAQGFHLAEPAPLLLRRSLGLLP